MKENYQIYLPYQFLLRDQSVNSDKKFSHKKMKTMFLLNILKSRRLTSTFFPVIVHSIIHTKVALSNTRIKTVLFFILSISYVHYEKPGEYGDEKTNVYHVKLSDSVASTGLTAERRAVLDSLKTGDEVELEWNHDYVTTEYEGGCSSSSPERPITHLAKK